MKSGKPSETRAPESAHTSAQTSRDSFTGCSSQVQARADEPRPKRQCRRPEKHVVRTTAIRDVAPPQPKIAGLDCANNPQPCLHYRSIIRQHPGTAYALNTCPYLNEPRGPDLGYKKAWEAQHPDGVKWREPKADGGLIPDRPPHEDPTINTRGCEPDEWPPYALYHEVDNYSKVIDPDFAHRAAIIKPQFIRYLDGAANGRIGNKWRCKPIPERHSEQPNEHSVVGADRTTTFYTDYVGVYTRTVYQINPDAADPNGDDGLSANDCYPRGVNNDARYQGFALLNDDPWFTGKVDDKGRQLLYVKAPPSNAKRHWFDSDNIVAIGANSSRRITEEEYEELQHQLGLEECSDRDCEGDENATKASIPIVTTLAPAAEGMRPTESSVALPRDNAGDARLPRETQGL
jgi:chitinase